jgi:hypothetical protein
MHKIRGFENLNKVNNFYSLLNGNISEYIKESLNYKIVKEINFGIYIA